MKRKKKQLRIPIPKRIVLWSDHHLGRQRGRPRCDVQLIKNAAGEIESFRINGREFPTIEDVAVYMDEDGNMAVSPLLKVTSYSKTELP